MADVPASPANAPQSTAENGAGGSNNAGLAQSIFGPGNRRIPPGSFRGYLFAAICIDLTGLPIVGDFFITYCRAMFWLNGYQTNNMATATILSMVGEVFPIIPASTAFVIWSYAINRASTKKQSEEEKAQPKPKFSLSEKGAAFGYMFSQQRGQGAGKSPGGPSATGSHAGKNPEPKGGGGKGELLTQTAASFAKKKVEKAKKREGTAPRSEGGMDGVLPQKGAEKMMGDYGRNLNRLGNLVQPRFQRQDKNKKGALGEEKPEDTGRKAGSLQTDSDNGKPDAGRGDGKNTGSQPVRPALYRASSASPETGAEQRTPLSQKLPVRPAKPDRAGTLPAQTPVTDTAPGGTARQEERAQTERKAEPPRFAPRETQKAEDALDGRNRDMLPLQGANDALQGVPRPGGRNSGGIALAPSEAEEAKRILAEEDLAPEESGEVRKILRKQNITIEEKQKIEVVIRQHQLKIVSPSGTGEVRVKTEVKSTASNDNGAEIKKAA